VPRAEEVHPDVLPLSPTTGAATAAPESDARHPDELPLTLLANSQEYAAFSLPWCVMQNDSSSPQALNAAEASSLVSSASLPNMNLCREIQEA